MSTLPPFTEPNWSQLPKEAVAWAVDEDGDVFIFNSKPYEGDVEWLGQDAIDHIGIFDLTGIDWRTTLRLRPTEEANPTLKGHEVAEAMKLISGGIEDCAEANRNYELERLAEEFTKALLANPALWNDSLESAAKGGFSAAECFIAEREKRRIKP